MNTSTGKREDQAAEASSEFGKFRDEVLNAGWLPGVEAQLETRSSPARSTSAALDADEFLRTLYRNQE
jgi:hypothetical protein